MTQVLSVWSCSSLMSRDRLSPLVLQLQVSVLYHSLVKDKYEALLE